MIISKSTILLDAQSKGYAVPAINIYNLEN